MDEMTRAETDARDEARHEAGRDVADARADAGADALDAVTVERSEAIGRFEAQVLALFRAHPELRFPGLDLTLLTQTAAEVEAAQREVESHERALEVARGKVAEAQASLRAKATQGLAYAAVFANEVPALLAEIESIRTPASGAALPARADAPKRRGRPPKSAGVLFAANDAQSSAAE